MGGEGGPELTVPASLLALGEVPDLHLILVGDETRIGPLLSRAGTAAQRCELLHTEQVISDEDSPRNALRKGTASSMYRAAALVQSGDVEAMVSAGNTGALLMIGRHLLKTISGVSKPAIVATIPGSAKQNFLLDVGANPECDAQLLFEFAAMGSVLAESLQGNQARVGLLNIGAEHHKGTDEVRQAAGMLEQCPFLNYIGFVEANELFEGAADVVVCDGFVGNVTIKSSAGVANVVKKLLAEQLESGVMARLSDPSARSMLQRLGEQINPQRFNGASLLGLQGSIVKSHGNATAEGFRYAVLQAVKEVENRVPKLIAEKVAAIMAAA